MLDSQPDTRGAAARIVWRGKAACPAAFPLFNKALEINNPKELQDDKDDGDDDQNVNQITGAWYTGDVSRSKKAEQPENYQNYDDRPQHGIPPRKWSMSATESMTRRYAN